MIDRRNLLEKSSHVSCYIIKKNTSIRMFFLQNEEIQNQPRLVTKNMVLLIPSAIKRQKSSLESLKYNYLGETFD